MRVEVVTAAALHCDRNTPRRRMIVFAALVSSLTACHQAAPTVQATTLPTSATPPARDTFVSDLSGVAFGNAFARATADGAPATDESASQPDEAIHVTATKDGDEADRSCGSYGIQSHAQATAESRPVPIVGVRQFGFTLSTTAYAKGGSWRQRVVLCRDIHNSVAVADASASGRLDLTYNAGPNADATEQLILRVSGATAAEAHVEVRDGQNQLLPLDWAAGGTWVAVPLSGPGAYTVRASITSHAENGGRRSADDQHRMTVSVSAQSLRDALALGYGQGPTNAVTLPLPMFVSTDAMAAALDSALFTDRHRLYPCAMIECGSQGLRDVYLETPRVSTLGGSVVLDMHLAGSYQFAAIFGGPVSGAIRATAVPVIERDTLRFERPTVDLDTHDRIVKWRAGQFERTFLDRMKQVRIDLTPRLQTAVSEARERFSVGRGGVCVLVVPTEAHIRSVRVETREPQGIVADFDIALSDDAGSACARGR